MTPFKNVTDLMAFLAVARERSFTKAAAKLGLSQSALSHTVRGLEERLGIRLLMRSTRSVAPTEAGERLLNTIAPRFEEIESELAALSELREKPAGTLRITASQYAADTVLWPKLAPLLRDYPDIRVEIDSDNRLKDIVAERFDAGVRLGDQVAKDMIAVRISPELKMAVVGTPGYLANHPAPEHPQDLSAHPCINLRLNTQGGLYPWEFAKAGQEINVRVHGQLVFNNSAAILQAALDGYGFAYLPDDMVAPHCMAGRLIRVLEDWTPAFDGFFLYYPSRRQASPAFSLLLEALRLPT